ncbi:NADPH-dependent diflavin oxidoreductase 1 [Leucoagaricus sp. SymC.cos]|nr:NADPH-dependent diflavin oxidoreductase 1 [Leucoagaricus sp. SymC.cos]
MSTHDSTSSDSVQERRLLILYATETGNAQDVSDRVARVARALHFRSQVMNVDSYTLENLVMEELIVFVVSTTGSGVEPRSMTPLWNMLLSSRLPADLFEDLSFAVFGLGDTSYEKFCWPAKLLSKRLRSLGATEICERGEGDEQHPLGIDGALEPWLEVLAETILEKYALPDSTPIASTSKVPPPRVILQPSDAEADQIPSSSPGSLSAKVIKNQRITAEDWNQDVRHVEFQFDQDVDYLPGDVAVIHPNASQEEVQELLESLGWNTAADEPLSIKERLEDQSLPASLPDTFTLRTLFTHYLDFNAVPRRTFFQYLRDFTSDDLEKERLGEFLSKEGADELYDYCYRVRRTIREIMTEFRYVLIPKDYVFDVFPFMRPRQFSIASSAKEHPRQVHLCVAIVKYRTKLKIPRKGVCTSYLSVLEEGLAANTLYFGCRSASKDEHYGTEWRAYSEERGLAYRVAHSRDGPEGVKRIYVQDLIEEDSFRIWKLLEDERAWVYISGSSNKMPAGVKAALAKAVEKEGGRSEDDAKNTSAKYEKFNVLCKGIQRRLDMRHPPHSVHRLDKDTTGALLLARSPIWVTKLHQQFLDGTIKKTYLALVQGGQEKFSQTSGVVTTNLSEFDGRVRLDPLGKETKTEWEVLGFSPKVPLTLLRLKLLTGHKHQLRVHLAKCLNAPVLGDTLYKSEESEATRAKIAEIITLPSKPMFLHASEISFQRWHKTGPKRRFELRFRVPVPTIFQVICRDAKIPVDSAWLKGGEMWLDDEPWRNSNHLLLESEECWVSPKLMPGALKTSEGDSGTVHALV